MGYRHSSRLDAEMSFEPIDYESLSHPLHRHNDFS